MEIRALRSGDDRSPFRSGDAVLDLFFHKYAGQNQFRHYLGTTYVAVEGEKIVGFATVAPRHLDIDDLPERLRKKLPRYPISVLGLGHLAVDTTARSLGLGAQLLRFVLRLAMKMSDEVGCAGVVVDAKEGAVGFYERYGFTPLELLEGQAESKPLPTAMWLPIQVIRAAGGR